MFRIKILKFNVSPLSLLLLPLWTCIKSIAGRKELFCCSQEGSYDVLDLHHASDENKDSQDCVWNKVTTTLIPDIDNR